MSIDLAYTIELRADAAPDEIFEAVSRGFNAYARGANSPQEPRIAYSVTVSGRKRTMSIRISATATSLGVAERGYAGLVMLLAGDIFRDPRIERATLENIRSSGEVAHLPGPRFGHQLLEADGIPFPWLSVPVPRSMARSSWDDVCKGLILGGVSVITDQSINLSANDLRARVDAVVRRVTSRTVLFFNATSRLGYLNHVADMIETELQARAPGVTIGLRLCPVSMGFSVMETVRQRGIPIFAYTLGPVPAGRRGWSRSAYASIVNLFGADVANVGLLTVPELEQGTLHEVRSGLAPADDGPVTIAAFTGGMRPRVAYQYAERVHSPYILHTMTPIFEAGTDSTEIHNRVAAMKEAALVGREGLDVEKLFASRSSRVRHWRALEES